MMPCLAERGTTTALSAWQCPCVRAISAEVMLHTEPRDDTAIPGHSDRMWGGFGCLAGTHYQVPASKNRNDMRMAFWTSQQLISLKWAMACSQVWGWGPEKQHMCNVLAFCNSPGQQLLLCLQPSCSPSVPLQLHAAPCSSCNAPAGIEDVHWKSSQ